MLTKARHLFAPHHSNNHRPKVLHTNSLLVLSLLLLVTQFFSSLLIHLRPGVLGFAAQIDPVRVVELTNNKRQQYNLPPLVLDDRLSDAARRKAADMINNNYWAHSSPTGVTPWYFILAAGYNYLHAGENLARDFSSADSAMNAWMNSATHKDNIISSRYTNIGIAVVDGQIDGVETTLIVQMFGTPQSQKPNVASGHTSVIKTAQAAATPTPTPTGSVPDTMPLIDPSPSPLPTQITNTLPSLYPGISPFTISKILSFAFAIMILIVFGVDWIVAVNKNLIRLSGKNWAHITFLAFVIGLLVIIKQGVIL